MAMRGTASSTRGVAGRRRTSTAPFSSSSHVFKADKSRRETEEAAEVCVGLSLQLLASCGTCAGDDDGVGGCGEVEEDEEAPGMLGWLGALASAACCFYVCVCVLLSLV